jgi:predicted transcriptional regulator
MKAKEPARYNVISMRVSDREFQALRCLAMKTSLSVSKVLRKAVEQFSELHYGSDQEDAASGEHSGQNYQNRSAC